MPILVAFLIFFSFSLGIEFLEANEFWVVICCSLIPAFQLIRWEGYYTNYAVVFDFFSFYLVAIISTVEIMFRLPIKSFLGVTLLCPFLVFSFFVPWWSVMFILVNSHRCCDAPFSCSFCTISSFFSTHFGRFFCCFGCPCCLPHSSYPGVCYWMSWALQPSFVALAWWLQVLHSSLWPAGCVPVVLFSIVLPLLQCFDVHFLFFCGDIIDAFLSLFL